MNILSIITNFGPGEEKNQVTEIIDVPIFGEPQPDF